MKTRCVILMLFLFPAAGEILAQNRVDTFKAFGFRNYSGEIIFRGSYRDREQNGEKIVETLQNYYFAGGIMMHANAYLLHPNFCEINLDAGYLPESNRDNFAFAPDQSEVRNAKKLNFLSTFFPRKKISFIVTANYDDSYARRENLTDIRTVNKYIGGSMIYTNKYIPLSFDVYKRKLVQTEIQTSRQLNIDQLHFEGRAEQSFTAYDKQRLVYAHKIYSNLNEVNFYSANTTDDVNFNSNISLGNQRVFTFNTTVSNIFQRGNSNYNRFQAMENLVIKLPSNFQFTTNYNYYNLNQPFSRMEQNVSLNSLHHKLYKSLDSKFYFEYATIRHTAFDQFSSKTGIDLNYNKKIPWGQLQLSYGYFLYKQKYSTDSLNINVLNEEYVLSDSKIVLLKRPYIIPSSIVVKDQTGTIIYQNGLDYFLIEQQTYMEIRRIPSGQIPNEGRIYVDYTARQPASYNYNANNHVASANVSLLKGKLDLYYRFALQDYSNLENTDFITLNFFTQHVTGVRFNIGMVSGGAEYDSYNSSILPYNMTRLYLSFQKNIGSKLIIVCNGNMQNYVMLNEPTSRTQQYADLTSKIEYTIVKRTKVNLDIMYRKQSGRGIDLDLISSRLEFSSYFYQIFIRASVEVYRRNYIGDKVNLKGINIQISRTF